MYILRGCKKMLPEFLQLVENLLNYNLYFKRENLDRTIMHGYPMYT